jgi:hypothetical protein
VTGGKPAFHPAVELDRVVADQHHEQEDGPDVFGWGSELLLFVGPLAAE